MSFTEIAKNESNEKLTENDALAYKSTTSALLDLFGLVGGARHKDDMDIINMFDAAYNENPEYTKKIVLYARNIREGGLGERRVGNLLLKRLSTYEPELIKKNFDTIVANGRFDDLYILDGTSIEKDMYKFMSKQISKDLRNMKENKPISQLGKWLKSVNASSKETNTLGKKTSKMFGLREKEYRKVLSALRSYLDVTEKKMCSNKWTDIDYKSVPSLCMNRNIKQFNKHDYEGFMKYRDSLLSGETKINASTLFPYDITFKMLYNYNTNTDEHIKELDILEMQWKNLPNYFTKGFNIVSMADVSGSMYGKPMATSIGLSIYSAQHNVGPYSELFMTFTDKPHFETITKDGRIYPKICDIQQYCGYNTNLDGALEEVLRVAKEAKESPDALLVISDCEIDKFSSHFELCGKSIVNKYINAFNEAGLKMPVIVFWNVEDRNKTFLDTVQNPYVRFISGSSASNFINLETIIKRGPYESMINILDKYSWK